MNDFLNFKSFSKQINAKAKETKTPVNGVFELTARCTLNCHFCYVHTADAVKSKSEELTTEQWKNIFSQAVDAGLLRATLSGGECLLRKDFRELYRFLYDRGVLITVKTNGTLLTEDDAEFFNLYRPEGIEITLYGSNNNVYADLCGVAAYDRVIDSIRLLKKYGLPLKLDLTFSKRNLEDREKLFDRLIEFNVPYQITDWLIQPRDGSCRQDFCLSNGDRLKIAACNWEKHGWKRFEHTDRAPEPCGSCAETQRGLPCNAGSCLYSVTYKGEMIPCLTIPARSVSLLTHSFTDAWKEICKETSELLRPVECSGCPYEKVCIPCVVLRSDPEANGHCNREVCAYMQQKYREGLLPPLGE